MGPEGPTLFLNMPAGWFWLVYDITLVARCWR